MDERVRVLGSPRPEAKLKIGQLCGTLRVIGLVGRKWFRSNKQSWLLWAVECQTCGQQVIVSTQVLARPHTVGCQRCYREELGKRTSVRLKDGATIADIARLTGLKLDTVYHRHIRGWPRHLLGQEPFDRGQKRR